MDSFFANGIRRLLILLKRKCLIITLRFDKVGLIL